MMPPYKHESIPSKDWLRLLAFDADDSVSLKCSLRSYYFDDAPHYYALSYHWGDVTAKFSLQCAEGSIEVSQSLHQALLRLRAISHQGSISHFWVDQICINQADVNERRDQVLQMQRIYTRSEQTLIWFTLSGSQSSRDIFDLLGKLHHASRARGKNVHRNNTAAAQEAENKKLGLPDLDSALWTGVKEFLANPWFQRSWVIQEAALSRTSPLILCEEQEMHFDAFFAAIQWVDSRLSLYLKATVTVPATPVLISRIRDLSHPRTGERCLWKLEAILRMGNHLRSTDPRDRIYALLGLVRNGSSDIDARHVLLPDYRRDVVELYALVTRYCIRESRQLYILGSGGLASSSPLSFPSWIPRWDCPRHPDVLLEGPHKLVAVPDSALDVVVYDRFPYRASSDIAAIVKDSDNQDELILGGLYIDSVLWCSDIQERESPQKTAQAIRSLWEQSIGHASLSVDPENQQFQDFAASFCMAVTSGLDNRDNSKFRQVGSNRNFWCFLTSCYDKNSAALEEHREHVDIYRRLGLGGDPLDMSSCLGGRKLFVTKAGRAGNGAATLQPEDDIFVLYGGAMPFILRPKDKFYEMVGEGYVHGIMDGEAIVAANEGGLEDEWVTLR